MTLKQERAAKKRLEKRLDDEWSRAIKERDGWTCQRCGTEYGKGSRGLHAAHIFSKGAHPSTRHDLENGTALCMRDHLYWAHYEPVEFYDWILKRMGKRRLDALRRRANTVSKSAQKPV